MGHESDYSGGIRRSDNSSTSLDQRITDFAASTSDDGQNVPFFVSVHRGRNKRFVAQLAGQSMT
jgi:hypothetical protein